jgi:hypothetical protein
VLVVDSPCIMLIRCSRRRKKPGIIAVFDACCTFTTCKLLVEHVAPADASYVKMRAPHAMRGGGRACALTGRSHSSSKSISIWAASDKSNTSATGQKSTRLDYVSQSTHANKPVQMHRTESNAALLLHCGTERRARVKSANLSPSKGVGCCENKKV